MELTRREWLLAAGAMALEVEGLSAARALAPRAAVPGAPELATLGQPPSLPDKASFPDIKGTYLNSASSHPRSAGSTDLVRKTGATLAGDANGFRPDERRIREHFATLINAGADEVVLVPSTQAGESLVAAALGLPEKGAHVVSDDLHFVGSQQMYTDMTARGLEVTWVKMKNNGIPLEDLDRAIVRGKTRLVAVSGTALVNGFQHDLKRVCEIAHAKGALVYADVIQTVGNAPFDVKDSGVDAAACGTYKWLMSSGTAFLYVKKASQARMQPPCYHWTRYTKMLPTTHIFPFDAPGPNIVDEYAAKDGAAGMFSMGYEPDPLALAGLEYSLPYIMNIGVRNIQAHAQTLTNRLKAELPKLGYPLMTPLDARSPIVTVAVKDAGRLAPAFAAANVRITTRWNHVRISPSVFNDMDDVDRLLAVMPKV